MIDIHHLHLDPLLWGALYGLGLGLLGGVALSAMRPFARDDVPAAEALLLLVALAAVAAVGSAFVLDEPRAIWTAAVAFLASATPALLWGRGTAERDDSGDPPKPLSSQEIWRTKTRDDCWILVTGSRAAGKTTLVTRMVEAAARSDRLRRAAPPREGESEDVRVAELPLRQPKGGVRTLRFWEHRWDETGPRRPPFADLDGVVMVIDPTSVRGAAETFPKAVKAGPDDVDVNTQAVALDAALAKAGHTVTAWRVLSKADLLRFSINDSLLKRVKAGPDWRDQLQNFSVVATRGLAESLGIGTRELHSLPEGVGSPCLVYAGSGKRNDSFGERDLLHYIIEALAQDALWR